MFWLVSWLFWDVNIWFENEVDCCKVLVDKVVEFVIVFLNWGKLFSEGDWWWCCCCWFWEEYGNVVVFFIFFEVDILKLDFELFRNNRGFWMLVFVIWFLVWGNFLWKWGLFLVEILLWVLKESFLFNVLVLEIMCREDDMLGVDIYFFFIILLFLLKFLIF